MLALAIAIVPDGPSVIVVSGGVRSIVHVRVAGLGSKLPVASRTRTANVCTPTSSPPYSAGDVHAANAEPSIEHSNVAPGPASGDRNVNVADGLTVAPIGPDSSVVSGVLVSTDHVWIAGDG